jgi:hypothetical protein
MERSSEYSGALDSCKVERSVTPGTCSGKLSRYVHVHASKTKESLKSHRF